MRQHDDSTEDNLTRLRNQYSAMVLDAEGEAASPSISPLFFGQHLPCEIMNYFCFLFVIHFHHQIIRRTNVRYFTYSGASSHLRQKLRNVRKKISNN